MGARRIVIWLLILSAVTCGSGPSAEVAGVSGIALHGRVIWATVLHPERCSDGVCQASYRIRISNTSRRDLYVQGCEVRSPPTPALATLPVMGLAGLPIRARATRSWTASFQLPATPKKIHELVSAALRCSGDDGQDNQAA